MQILLLRKRICMRACMYVRMYVCIFRLRIHICNVLYTDIWVVVKIMVPFWVPIYNAAPSDLVFRVPKKGPLF